MITLADVVARTREAQSLPPDRVEDVEALEVVSHLLSDTRIREAQRRPGRERGAATNGPSSNPITPAEVLSGERT